MREWLQLNQIMDIDHDGNHISSSSTYSKSRNTVVGCNMGKNAELSSLTLRRSLEELSKDELIDRVMSLSMDSYKAMRNDEKLQKYQTEAQRRENILVMRLATKEQENQVEDLRSSLPSGLRNVLLDPVVNSMFGKMRDETVSSKEKLEQSRQDLDAWKFTPDSTTGKRLMAKCRRLITENEELGRMVDSGRLARLQGDLVLAHEQNRQLKESQAEVDELLLELDEDMEGMQATVMFLQEQLNASRQENRRLRTLSVRIEQPTNGLPGSNEDGPTSRTDPVTGDFLPSSPTVLRTRDGPEDDDDNDGVEDGEIESPPSKRRQANGRPTLSTNI